MSRPSVPYGANLLFLAFIRQTTTMRTSQAIQEYCQGQFEEVRRTPTVTHQCPHMIEDSGVRRVGQPSPLLRKHGLSVYRGNAQPASTRSSAAPTRHGRVIGATKSAYPELGSLPIVFRATRFLIFIFLLFFVFGPCARLSWPSRQLLSAR